MQVDQFSEALRDANESDRTESSRKEQFAAIDSRIKAIDEAIARLSEVGQ